MNLRIAPSATADLNEIRLYIARDSDVSAAHVVDLILDKIHLLGTNPMIGSLRPEIGSDIRSLPVLSFRVYYRYRTNTVRILHVRHAKRDESRMPKL